MFHIFFSERSGTGELGKSASFNPSMTRWQGVLCNWRMYPCLARVTDLSFLREAIAEMRNKEVVATGTLLNNGQQVLFVKYLRSYLTLTQKAITSLPIRNKEVVWKHGTLFPGTHHTTIRRFVPDRQLFIISKFVCVSSKYCINCLCYLYCHHSFRITLAGQTLACPTVNAITHL